MYLPQCLNVNFLTVVKYTYEIFKCAVQWHKSTFTLLGDCCHSLAPERHPKLKFCTH